MIKLFLSVLLAVFLSGCFQRSKDITEYIARADALKAAGDDGKARVELQNAFKIAPGNPKLNLALAQAEEAAGNLQVAIPYYVRAATPDANLPTAQLRVIDLLLDSNRLQDAAGRINMMRGSFPNDIEALAMKADLEERQEKFFEARADAMSVLQKAPAQARALVVLALIELRNKDPQAALSHVDAGLAKQPDNVRLLQAQAAALMTLNQPEKAADALKAITRAAPSNVPAQRALADLEARNGHFDQAAESFRQALAANPDSEDMQLAFVQFLASQDKEADLVAYMQKLIDRFPEKSIYDLVLAEHFRVQGDTRQALDVLAAAQKRLGDQAAGRNVVTALAKIHAMTGRVDLAQADLRTVLDADPQNQEALLFQATLDREGGRVEAAIANLLAVLRADPVSGRAYQQLASAYLQRGDKQHAVEAIKRATSVMPGDVPAQIRLATFLQAAGSSEDARNIMAQLTVSHSEAPLVWSANGQLAAERKDWAAASRSLSRLKTLPQTESAVAVLNGQIMSAQGNATAAMASFKVAISAVPNPGADLIGWFARASIGANQAAVAQQFLSGEVAALPPAAQANVWPAIMTLRADAHDYDGALDAFHHATAITPKNVVLYNDAVKILVAQDKLDEARQTLQQGIAAGIPKWMMMLTMGFVDSAAHEPALAMADFKAASDDNPANVLALNNYATLLADAEPRNLPALTNVRDRLKGQESASDSSVVDTIAWLDYRLGNFDEAKALLSRIDAEHSASPQRRFHFAAVLLATGDKAAGLTLLDALKGASFPGSAEITALSPS